MFIEPRKQQTLPVVLANRVAAHGDKPWIITDDATYSYAEAHARSNRLARGLSAQGITRGDTVLVMLPDGIEIIDAWCALAKLGAVEVPVNTQLRGNVLRHILHDARASVMIVADQFLDRLAAVAGGIANLRHLIICGSAARLPAGLTHLGRSDFEDHFAPSDAPVDAGARYCDLKAVMYTSGTTGPSKGVMVTHAHAFEYARACMEMVDVGETDIYYNPLPLFHIAGQWAGVYASCIAGACVVIPKSFSLSAFWPDIRKHGATCTFLLGAMANWIYRQPPNHNDADNPMERMMVVPLLSEVEDFKKRFGVRVSTTWGSTEINCPTRSGFDLANNITCGRVADDLYEVRIVNDDDEETEPGVPGEATVRAREPWITMAGYWNNPEATANAWRNQWVHTGDMLMKDQEGNLYFVDRTKDAIRRRGENISSMEVENEINAHPGVLECAVIPVDAQDAEQDVMAVIVATPGDRALDPADLIKFLEPRLARFMVPRYVELVDALPKTPTGKIQKFDLRAKGVTAATWDRDAAGIILAR